MLGFGFLFRAVDDGLANKLANTKQAFEGLGDVARKTGGVMKDAFTILSLTNIQSQLETLTGGSTNLVNSLEAEFHELGKTAQPILAGMGLRGKELNKAMARSTGLAHKWQVGVDGVAKTMVEVKKSTREATAVLDKMGLSMEELVKFERATGQSGADLIATIHSLTNSYGFSTEQAEEFLNKFTEMSQATTTAQQGFADLPKNLAVLDGVLADIGSTIKDQPRFVRKFLMETQKLSSVFELSAGSMEKAQEASNAFTKFLLEGRRDLTKAKAGLGDFGETFEGLAIATGHAGGVMELFNKGPEGSLKMLLKMRKGIGNNVQRLMLFDQELAKVNPELSFLVSQGNRVTEEFGKVNKTIDGTTGGLKGLTKAAQPATRTLDEQMELMEQRFDSSINKIAGGTRGYVKFQKEAFGSATKDLEKMTKHPVWGDWAKRLLKSRREGMTAFFRPIKHSAKEIVDDMDGIAKAMGKGKLFGRLEALKRLGPAGIFLDLNKAMTGKKGMNEAMADANAQVKKLHTKLTSMKLLIKSFLPGLGMLGGALGVLFIGAKVLAPIFSLFSMIAGSGAVSGILGAIATGIGTVVTALGGWVVLAIAAVAAIGAFVIGLAALFALPQEYKDKFGDWIGGIGDSMDGLSEQMMDWDADAFVDDVANFLEGVFDGIGEAIGGLFHLGEYLIDGIEPPEKNAKLVKGIGNFMKGLGKIVLVGLFKLFQLFDASMKRLMGWLITKMGELWDEFSRNLERDVLQLRDDLAAWLEESIMGGFGDLVLMLSNEFDAAMRTVDSFIDDVKEAFNFRVLIMKGLKGVDEALKKYVLVPILKFVILATDALHKGFHKMFLLPIENAIKGIGKVMRSFYDNPVMRIALDKVGFSDAGIKKMENFGFDFDDDALKAVQAPIKKHIEELEKSGTSSLSGNLDKNSEATAKLTQAIDNLNRAIGGGTKNSGGGSPPIALSVVGAA